MTRSMTAADVVAFWQAAGPKAWFTKDVAFDRRFDDAFRDLHFAAARRECDSWLESADGALALMLLLDQFPRNAFRGTAHMFATDLLALSFAETAIAAGHDLATDPVLRVFFYLPFEHAEDLAAQDRACALCAPLEGYLKYAEEHRDIIRRFGRFPHRNPLLGRETTAEETAFLAGGGFAG